MSDDIMSSINVFADHTKSFKDVQTDELILQKEVDCQVATKMQCNKMYTHGVWQSKDMTTV